MRWHLVGGLSDGEVVDTAEPAGWSGAELASPVAPALLHVHSAAPNRAVYRLIAVDATDATYQLDPDLTAEARAMSQAEWIRQGAP